MKRTTMLLLIVDVVLKKQESRVAALVLCPLCKSFTLYNVGTLVICDKNLLLKCAF